MVKKMSNNISLAENRGILSKATGICKTPNTSVHGTGKRVVLLIAILSGFITPFDSSAVNIALPSIGKEFHMVAIALSWIATAYLLSSAVSLVPFGKIADIYGRKKIYIYGISVFSLASLVMTIAPSTEIFIGIRIVQGLGAAMIFGTGIAIITSVFPSGERGKAIGITLLQFILGCLSALSLWCANPYLGWRSIFFVNVPIGIATILLILGKLKGEWAECKGDNFDLTGSVIYSAAIVAVMYGFSVLPDLKGAAPIAVGIIGVLIFALYEMRISSPVLEISLLTKNRIFAFANLSALINYSATFAVTFLLSLDLQYTKGFRPEYAGIILVVQPVVQAMILPIAGKLSDRVESRIVASVGMALTAVGLFCLIFLTEEKSLWHLVFIQLVLGVGFGLFSSPNTNAIMSSVDKRFYGVASGMNGTMRLLGQMLSMGIAMMIFAIFIGPVEITPEYYTQFVLSLHYAFILFTIFCILGTFTSLVRGKTSLTHPEIPEEGKKAI